MHLNIRLQNAPNLSACPSKTPHGAAGQQAGPAAAAPRMAAVVVDLGSRSITAGLAQYFLLPDQPYVVRIARWYTAICCPQSLVLVAPNLTNLSDGKPWPPSRLKVSKRRVAVICS